MLDVAVHCRRARASEPLVRAFLEERNIAAVARRGELVDMTGYPAIAAAAGDTVTGVLSHAATGPDCEILTLHVDTHSGRVVWARRC